MAPILRDLTNPAYPKPPLNMFVLAASYPLPEGSRADITQKFIGCRDMHLLAHQQEWAGVAVLPPLDADLENDLTIVEEWLDVPKKRDAVEAYVRGWGEMPIRPDVSTQKRAAA